METELRSWFVSNGGIIHPDVEIASGPTGNHLRLKVGCSLAPGTMIFSCPHRLTISWLNLTAGQTPFIDRFRLSPVKTGSTVVTKFVLVRFFLVEQYLLGAKSFWWPYIRCLPQPFKGNVLNESLWYNDDDFLWLRGTNMEDAMRRTEQTRRKEYEEAIGALSDTGTNARDAWSWDLYKWAGTIMHSRCFPGSALANNELVTNYTDDPAIGAPPDVDHDSPVLIPCLDLANHRPTAEVTWLYNQEDCCLVVDETYKGEQQIWNNYGPKPNEQLIMGYGFSLFRNPADRCNIAVSSELPPRNKLSNGHLQETDGANAGCWDSTVSSIPDLTDTFHNETIEWVRLVDSTKDDEMDDNKPPYEFSPCFLSDLSAALFNVRELLEPNRSGLTGVNFSGDMTTRNKLHTMCAVIMKLQRQTSAITSHDEDLPQWPVNDKQFHAARYRRSQLHILRSVTEYLLDDLRGSVGLNPLRRRVVQIVRLEHILLESPKEFLVHFRACLNAGLGTRKASRIREKQWVECAFTLWMYGLWLWDASGQARCDPSPGADFDVRISQWLFWVRSVYGDVPERENLVAIHRKRKPGPFKSYRDGESESGNISNGIVGSEIDSEDYLVASSYLQVITAAVEKNPNSIYNYAEVTTMPLLWCLSIIRQEGFMCPNLEGKTGEEHDEFVLFLEHS